MPQRVVDLSLLIEDNMPAHKLFQRPVLTTHLSHESSARPSDSASPATR